MPIILLLTLIGIATSLEGVGLDSMLYENRLLFASDVLEGVAAAVLSGPAPVRLQRERRDALIRMQVCKRASQMIGFPLVFEERV